MTRDRILAEIRRTAEANGGQPLGKSRFLAETGIRESDWLGRYWVRWSEALEAAGYGANAMNPRYDDERILAALVEEVRRLGRMPVAAELRLARRRDQKFPSHNTVARLGSKDELTRSALNYCERVPGYEDVVAILAPLVTERAAPDLVGAEPVDTPSEGFVYLLKSGRHYKIGLTLDVEKRKRELRIQLPEPVVQVHAIATDDPLGIERYWHGRFSDRRKNGEWFVLTSSGVAAFRRRKFM